MTFKALTFDAEYQEGGYWLVVIDSVGTSRRLAQFVTRDDIVVFKETLALAKAAAHAHGMGGI